MPLSVLLLFLLRNAPGAILIMALTLAVALYLTVIELRSMDVHWKWWAWWLSLVFLTHFIGYLILRVYVAYRTDDTARTFRDKPLGKVAILAVVLDRRARLARTAWWPKLRVNHDRATSERLETSLRRGV